MSVTLLFTRAPPFCLFLCPIHVCLRVIFFITLQHTCAKLGDLLLAEAQSLVPSTLLDWVRMLNCELGDLFPPCDNVHFGLQRLTLLNQRFETCTQSCKFAICFGNFRRDNGQHCLVT